MILLSLNAFLIHIISYILACDVDSCNAAALLKQELAATSAAGALDADSSGSEATAE